MYLSGLIICFLRSNYAFLDRRGRRSLQRKIKLPYENQPLRKAFFFSSNGREWQKNQMIFKRRISMGSSLSISTPKRVSVPSA